MDLNELKTKYPEVYKAVCDEIRAQVSAELDLKHKETLAAVEGSYVARISTMEATMKDQQTQMMAMQKDIAISKEAGIKAEAEKIWTEKLLASAISDHLHDKVRSQVKYGSFVKDGAFDVNAFSGAVDAEIKDWETRMESAASQTVLGGGYTVKVNVIATQDKEDDDAVDKMLAMVSQGKKE